MQLAPRLRRIANLRPILHHSIGLMSVKLLVTWESDVTTEVCDEQQTGRFSRE